MPSYCSTCGRQPTTRGTKRTINPISRICSECESKLQTSIDSSDNTEDNEPSETLLGDLVNKSGSELSAIDIFKIVQAANIPTIKKIEDLSTDVTAKMTHLENRVKILESDNDKKDEDIVILKHTVTNMQKALNSLDQVKREVNAMINGLPEGEMESDDDNHTIISNDPEKVNWILKIMDCNHFNLDKLQKLNISRLGKSREGYNRVMRITFESRDDRNIFVANKNKLKSASSVWEKVYVNKDQHPVIRGESNRIRKKRNDLRNDPANKDKSVTIKDGNLLVDENIVDKHMFFRQQQVVQQ